KIITKYLKFVKLNNTIENIIPTIVTSITSKKVKRKTGNKYINAPELMKIGGKIIFFMDVGCFAAFERIKIIVVAINRAIIVLPVIKTVLFNIFIPITYFY